GAGGQRGDVVRAVGQLGEAVEDGAEAGHLAAQHVAAPGFAFLEGEEVTPGHVLGQHPPDGGVDDLAPLAAGGRQDQAGVAARAAAARARAVPSTLDRRVSAGEGPREAARWNTPSQPRIASTSDSSSPRSAKTRSTPSGSTEALASLRMAARTGRPAVVKRAT